MAGLGDHRFRRLVALGRLDLDDLFADPAARGRGVGAALIAQLQQIARDEGATVVRWITADDNATAQRLYDRVATKTRWLTYDAAPTGD